MSPALPSDEQGTDERTELVVNVNLDALLGSLQREIQRVTNLVAVGLQSPVALDAAALAIRTDSIDYRFGSVQLWNSDNDARADYENWVYGNGLRDVIESVSTFLESVREVLALWALGDRQKSGESLTGATWVAEMQDAAKRFHRLGFPDKVEALRVAFDTSVDAVLNEHVLSVNVARNCLVHRRGVVSERDLNRDNALVVAWRRIAVILQDEDGEHQLVLGKTLEKEARVVLRIEDSSKEFKLGERVVFTGVEFAEVCWSMFAYSAAWGEVLNRSGADRGFIDRSVASPLAETQKS